MARLFMVSISETKWISQCSEAICDKSLKHPVQRTMFAFTFSGAQRQLVAALTASTSIFIVGGMMGWPAPTFKKLREPDSPIRLTPYEEAWVVNALYITTILSPLPIGILMNRLGRRTLMLILSLFPTLSWVLIYLSSTASTLIAARALAGFWYSGCQTVVPIYVGEIAEPRLRGVSGTFFMVNGFAGNIFICMVGPYVSMQTMAIISGVLPIIFFVLFSFCPESPYYYVMRGRNAAAADALTWFREGAPAETVQSELTTIVEFIDKEAQAGENYFQKMLNLIMVPANRKAFIIVEVMNALQRFSGLSSLTAYSTVILPDRLGSLTADHCTLIIRITWLVASLGCSILVDRVGRKPLLYVSSVGMFTSMIPIAIWYYLDRETSVDVSTYNWFPFAGILVWATTFSLGLGPIAPSLQGELFPSNLKGQASALTTMNGAGSAAIIVAVFAVLTVHVGLYVNFLIFSAVGLLSLVFTYCYVIETKGKSLQMIQAELRGDMRKDKVLQKTERAEANGGI